MGIFWDPEMGEPCADPVGSPEAWSPSPSISPEARSKGLGERGAREVWNEAAEESRLSQREVTDSVCDQSCLTKRPVTQPCPPRHRHPTIPSLSEHTEAILAKDPFPEASFSQRRWNGWADDSTFFFFFELWMQSWAAGATFMRGHPFPDASPQNVNLYYKAEKDISHT